MSAIRTVTNYSYVALVVVYDTCVISMHKAFLRLRSLKHCLSE